jgi:hypothetical protein
MNLPQKTEQKLETCQILQYLTTQVCFFALNNLLTTMSFSVSLGFSLISVVLKWFQQHLQGALDSMGWEGNSRRCTLLRFNITLLSIAFIANSLPVSRSSTKCTL